MHSFDTQASTWVALAALKVLSQNNQQLHASTYHCTNIGMITWM